LTPATLDLPHELPSRSAGPPLLYLSISVDYPGRPGVLRNAMLEMEEGEMMGLVGPSGEGKSTIALAVLGLLRMRGGKARGDIRFRGADLAALSERQMRRVRGREIALVPQSPIAALNPALSLGTQLGEAWSAHRPEPFREFEPRLRELLANVSLPVDPSFLRRYPGELSVGLAQRVLIAMALIHRPALVIADEPTSALDMITQSEILGLLKRLNREFHMGMLYISHDLVSIAALCHRVAILHAGEVIECGPTEQIFRSPSHPYTQRLIAAIPANPYQAR